MPTTDQQTTPAGGQAAAAATQVAGQAAVVDAVENPTTTTQTIAGTLQTAAQTTPGAIGFTGGVTAGSQLLGNLADIPELASIAWGTTFAYQGVKHHHAVDQDRYKWWLLPLLSLAIGLVICYITTHGDLWLMAAKAFRACAVAAANAALYYHVSKPIGLFSSADEITQEAQA